MKGGKSLHPVSERFVPGQSIKNVSRAEIIKVRISGRAAGSDERRGKEMYDARRPARVIENGWGAGEGSARRMFEIFPRPTRGSRWEIFIDSYPSAVARIWLRVNMIFLLGSSRWLLACFVHLCGHVHTYTYVQTHTLLCVITHTFDITYRKSKGEKMTGYFLKEKSVNCCSNITTIINVI